jgi:hypothetical protein
MLIQVLQQLVVVAEPAILDFIEQSRFPHLEDGGVQRFAQWAVGR